MPPVLENQPLFGTAEVFAGTGVDRHEVADVDERRDGNLEAGLGDGRLVLGSGRRPLNRPSGLEVLELQVEDGSPVARRDEFTVHHGIKLPIVADEDHALASIAIVDRGHKTLRTSGIPAARSLPDSLI